MPWSEQELKTSFLASLGAPPGGDCPPPEAIWDALNLNLRKDRRFALIVHTAACSHCAQAWQAAKLIAEEEQGGVLHVASKPAGGRWRRWLRPPVMIPALAGVAALLVALVWLGPREPGLVAPPIESGVMRGLRDSPELLTEDGATRAAGDILAWHGVAGATHHKLVMYSEDGDRRLELPVAAANQLVLGEEVIRTFDVGQTVYWYVVAVDGPQPGSVSEVRRFALTGFP